MFRTLGLKNVNVLVHKIILDFFIKPKTDLVYIQDQTVCLLKGSSCSVCLSVCLLFIPLISLFVCLLIYLFACLSVSLPTCLSVCFYSSKFTNQSTQLFIYLYICLPACLFAYMSVFLSFYLFFIYLFACLSLTFPSTLFHSLSSLRQLFYKTY